jgi:hypothetical protein
VTIDFFRLTNWCVVGVQCWPSLNFGAPADFQILLGVLSRRGWLSGLGACEWQ